MTRKSRRELERELGDLAESSDDDAGDGRALVGPDGILAPPERFGYGRADDGGGDADP
jgi:uncharacterized membrane protein